MWDCPQHFATPPSSCRFLETSIVSPHCENCERLCQTQLQTNHPTTTKWRQLTAHSFKNLDTQNIPSQFNMSATISAQGSCCTPILIHPATPTTPHKSFSLPIDCTHSLHKLPHDPQEGCTTASTYCRAACCTSMLARVDASPTTFTPLTTLPMLLGRLLLPADSRHSLQLLQLLHGIRSKTISHTEDTPNTDGPRLGYGPC
jgi:hypothetical protein